MLNNTNITTTDENALPSILNIPWIVKVETRTVIIPGDSTPQYNKAAEIEVSHTLLSMKCKDLDGKYHSKEVPLTKKQAMKKLQTSSRCLSNAIDRMNEMENW